MRYDDGAIEIKAEARRGLETEIRCTDDPVDSPACEGPANKASARLALSTAYAAPVRSCSTPARPGSESRARDR